MARSSSTWAAAQTDAQTASADGRLELHRPPYQPQPEILDGRWTFPAVEAVT